VVAKLPQQPARFIDFQRVNPHCLTMPCHFVCFVYFVVSTAFSGCRRKKWRGFGNFVPEFFIDPEARRGKISRLVHNLI
jgi:hypothetical protein